MRTYAPAGTRAVLDQLLEEPSLARGVVHHEVIEARTAEHADWPAWLDPRIRAGLAKRGIERPYTHQADAIEAVHARRDVVVVTPTASGKSLCYTVPVLQALAEDPSARALFLFPTKALGQDQVTEFGELVLDAGLEISAACYDGDTPAPIRSAVRKAGQVVVTNPDMLHSAILPHHTKWFQLFEQLRVIVLDELHTYRGVFGSHVANVLRRLLRLCAHYGSNPVIVCCSATIGNPAELAEQLTGRPMQLVDRNGAPSGEKHLLLVDPPVLDPATGARGLRAHARPALGAAVPARRAPDRGVRQEPGRGRDHALEPSRDPPRGPRAAEPDPGLPGGLPADGAPVDRARAARRGGAGRREHQRPGARGRHRPAGCRRARGVPGLDRRHVAADGPRGSAGRRERRDPCRVAGTGGPVRDPPPGVRPRRAAGGGPGRPGQPPRAARPRPVRGVRAAVRSRVLVRPRSRRTTCSRSSARAARSARRTTGGGTGARRTSRRRRSRSGPPRRRTS